MLQLTVGNLRFGVGGVEYLKVQLCIRVSASIWLATCVSQLRSCSYFCGSGVLVGPEKLNEQFRKALLPFFCRGGMGFVLQI